MESERKIAMNQDDWDRFLQDSKKLTIEDRLNLVKRKIDRWNHIEVNQEEFKKTENPAILYVCPAKVYEKNEETGECIVNFENCLECGTCQVSSPNIVTWRNPNGGFGVSYSYS
jgi:ferredoxin like protein